MSSDSSILLRMEGLSKKFCRTHKRSLWYGIRDVLSEINPWAEGKKLLRKNEFWALRDVNLVVERGEFVAILGHNGAGKSTLLRLVSGIYQPDSGTVKVTGRVGAWHGISAGFKSSLTARENIFLKASLMGISHKKIKRNLDEIVEFSGLEKFLDSPVKNFSTGMKSRLGFSVATQVECDLLLIDQVLAVGDYKFKRRCLNWIQKKVKNGMTVMAITHALQHAASVAKRAVILNQGKLFFDGSFAEGANHYLALQSGKPMSPLKINQLRRFTNQQI